MAGAPTRQVMDFDPVNSCGPWIDDEGGAAGDGVRW